MQPQISSSNGILVSLSAQDRDLVSRHLERVEMPVRFRLADADERIGWIYFLDSGIASTTTNVRHEVPIEVGIIGREGIANLPLLIGSDRSPSDTFMQIAGAGQRIATKDIRGAMQRSATLTTALLRYVHVFMVQNASTVLANGRATISERLARWLLMALDRVDGDEVALTHEFLATMLGVRRPGVTVAIRGFERQGCIAGGRGLITVLDRAVLVAAANGYYGVAEAEYLRLFGGPVPDTSSRRV